MIDPPGAGLEGGERRVVTILFADVKGFTAMSERLDPEEVREIMNRAFGLLSQVVYDQGGVVDKYVGDCLMALFGVPISKEDDAIRAVRAGLKLQVALAAFGEELRRSQGLGVSMRVGINTGLVLAGEVGSLQRHDFTVMGDSVNTASRIEHDAEPGRVWIGPETARLVGAAFTLKKLGARAIRGKERKIQLYQVESEGAAPGAVAPGLRSAFVGRRKELRLLEGAWESARGGETTVATVVGDAGLGKTQLVARFLADSAGGNGGGPKLLRVSCPPGGLGPYGVFIEISRAAGVEAPAPGAADWKDRFFLAFERWLMREAGSRPVLLALEDLHFADSGAWELLGFLVNRLRDTPVMILSSFRPSVDRSLHWLSAQNYVPVALKPLAGKEALAVVERSLGRNTLPDSFKESLIRRSGGNPYFLTELVWSLADRGELERRGGAWCLAESRGRPRIPETVQAALSARLDQLKPEARSLLQAASVLGMEFSEPVLREVAASDEPITPLLEELVSRRFLTKVLGCDGAEAYGFLHALLQEVCAEALLRPARQRYHRRAGEAFARLAPDPHGPALSRIADHFYQSGDRVLAFPLVMRAAKESALRYALDEALQAYGRALELIGADAERDGVTPAEIHFGRGGMLIAANDLDGALVSFRKCLDALGCGHPLRVEALRKMARIRVIRGEPELAQEIFREALDCGALPSRHRAEIYYEMAGGYFRIGKDPEAMEWLMRAAQEAARAGLEVDMPTEADVHQIFPALSVLAEAA